MKIRRSKSAYSKKERIITKRKYNAAVRAINKEKEKIPLFAHEVTITPEERLEAINKSWLDFANNMRLHRAQGWRLARRILRYMPVEERTALLEVWNNASYPAEPCYLLDFLRQQARFYYDAVDRPIY
jgi:hypothetical protein